MIAEALLRLAVDSLGGLGIDHMVTGSLASAFYGEPRSTQDLDIVVESDEVTLQELGRLLRDAGLYCEPIAITEAAATGGMFNAIDPETGWKIDFILLKDTRFNRQAFDKRRGAELDGVQLQLIRPEDIVLAKLQWASLGGSDRQILDVLGVLMVQGASLDREYIEQWVETLGVGAEWTHALQLERQTKETDA